ncbi:hypothetical protein PN36_07680 [Candidatus Thiomargarita nelsonii]|uniref:Uncharacterized protein n=1 Tax=Candidatus Thiomargarita nelsonii TaxID=1003181 RepID=A0A0A6P8F6_9GAMM|nr:hypothetical protein PN36_07680 [Candidatus Thiomargarita nelsonii]
MNVTPENHNKRRHPPFPSILILAHYYLIAAKPTLGRNKSTKQVTNNPTRGECINFLVFSGSHEK